MSGIRVCFSHRTAFQILRAVPPAKRKSIRRGAFELPDRSPSGEELRDILDRIVRAFPAIRFDDPVHVLLRTAEHRRLSADCREHVCAAAMSGSSFFSLLDGVYVVSPSFAFVNAAASSTSAISLSELAFELCGTYQGWRTGVDSAYDTAPLASVRELRAFAERYSSLDGARKALRSLRYVADGSASARETKQTLVLGLPHRYGGYALGIPRLNYEVQANGAARELTGKSCFRCDLCWPEAKVDVEYQSRLAHEGEPKRLKDSRRANALASMGWTVVGVTNDELDSLAATDAIADTIRRRLGKPSRVRVANHHARKLKLRRQLGLPVGLDR